MQRIKNYLKENSFIIPLAVVTFIVGIVYLISYTVTNIEWLKQFSASLFITIIGIWITVLCIDQIIKKKEQREKNRFLNIAYSEINRALEHYFYCMDRIYRASSKKKPELKQTFKEMYNSEHYREAFINCDFSKIAEYQNCSWGHFINYQTTDLINKFDNILSKYSFVLDADTLTMIEFSRGHIWVLVSSQMENPDGKRDIVYGFYNEFLNMLCFISEGITLKSGNQKFKLSYNGEYWDDEKPLDIPGSARFDFEV